MNLKIPVLLTVALLIFGISFTLHFNSSSSLETKLGEADSNRLLAGEDKRGENQDFKISFLSLQLSREIDTLSEWRDYTLENKSTILKKADDVGGRFDLLGNGSLILEKNNPKNSFWRENNFKENGLWSSKWIRHGFVDSEMILENVRTSYKIYGQKQDM